jgi:hypothetical protein
VTAAEWHGKMAQSIRLYWGLRVPAEIVRPAMCDIMAGNTEVNVRVIAASMGALMCSYMVSGDGGRQEDTGL